MRVSTTPINSNLMDDPDSSFSIVVTDMDGEPVGVLEKWSEDGWFWAKIDDFKDLN